MRNNISHDTAIYNLLNSQNLKAALSIAEILGIEKSSPNAKKLVDSIRMKLEVRTCTEELLIAIQKREMNVLEAAISRANKIITSPEASGDARLSKEYSRAKMLLDWLSQMNQARLRLKTAIISRDQNLLEIAIEKFKDYNLSDESGDLKIAKKLLKVFHCRTSLALAMESRDLNVIAGDGNCIDWAIKVTFAAKSINFQLFFYREMS